MVSEGEPGRGVRTVPAHDELAGEGEALVLIGGTVRRVSLIGIAIRDIAAEGISVDDLVVALEEEFGTPPGESALELTRRAVDDLIEAGLLADWRG